MWTGIGPSKATANSSQAAATSAIAAPRRARDPSVTHNGDRMIRHVHCTHARESRGVWRHAAAAQHTGSQGSAAPSTWEIQAVKSQQLESQHHSIHCGRRTVKRGAIFCCCYGACCCTSNGNQVGGSGTLGQETVPWKCSASGTAQNQQHLARNCSKQAERAIPNGLSCTLARRHLSWGHGLQAPTFITRCQCNKQEAGRERLKPRHHERPTWRAVQPA